MNDPKKGIFFSQLQVVRGIAALLVILSHTYALKIFFKDVPVKKSESVFANIGVIGLTIFFVLSGFLITYLLLNEKAATNTINIKRFYIRRILRIWPLYYLLILIGHFILPSVVNSNFESGNITANFWLKSVLYFLILPNYVLIIFKPTNPYIDITWSIGVEEQFYLVWPQIIKRKKSILAVVFILVIVQLLAEIFTHYAAFYKYNSNVIFTLNKAVRFIEWTRAGYFSIGAISAIIYTRKLYEQNKLIKALIVYAPIILAAVFITSMFWFFYLQFFILAICYGFFQLYLITQNYKSNWLSSFFEWLGKISYGLYLWHCIIIVFAYKAYESLNIAVHYPVIISMLLYVIIISCTVFISWLSYTFFESFFLNLKKKMI